jgi:hypothetical protein
MFPDYKKVKKSFLWFEWEDEVPDGWKDLGPTGFFFNDRYIHEKYCGFCSQSMRIGKEGEVIFKYCPRCFKRENRY